MNTKASQVRRAAARAQRRAWWISGAIVLVSVVGMVSVVMPHRGTASAAPAGHHHPQPRVGVTANQVLPAFMVSNEAAKPAYAVARAEPALLDGLYCYCNCRESSGHRSLLICFQDQHGANCDICQRQAQLAAQMTVQGAGIDQIRAAMDALYGT